MKKHPRLNYLNKCYYCKKKFHPYSRKAQYCSLRCRDLVRRKGKIVKCFYCNKKIYKKRKWFGRVKLFYCNKNCKNLDSRFEGAINEIRRQIRTTVDNAIREGRLQKLPCAICGNEKSCAHHYLGYAKKYWLNVEWLCRSHHGLIHQKHIREKHGV